MANALFRKAREAFGIAQINLLADDIRVLLTDSSYTPNINADTFVADIPPSAINPIRSGPLTGRVFPLGVFDADDVILPGVMGSVRALVIYKHTGSDASSRLIHYIDTAMDTLPTSASGLVEIRWPSAGIFRL